MLIQHVEGFLTHLRVEKSASGLTITGYKTDLNQFFSFISVQYKIPVEEVSRELLNHRNVREYLAFLQVNGLSRSTTARKLASLRSFVKYLCREGVLEGNPIAAVATPKQDKRLPKFLYPREIELLINAPDISTPNGTRDKTILETLYATGLRVSELVGMDIKDIDFGEQIIKVRGKGNKERIVPFGSKAREALINYIETGRNKLLQNNGDSCQALFLNKYGNRLSQRSVRNILNKYVEDVALNQKISPHTLRHTFATHLLNGGSDLRTVQELLGHVKLSTTQIYTHLTRDNIKTIHNETHPRR